MIDVTDILLAIIAFFTILQWLGDSQRILCMKIKYGKHKRKFINYVRKRK